MVAALRELAGSIPGASALLERASPWLFSHTSADGVKKNRIAHGETTEGAFEKMRGDLAQCSLATGGATDVLIKALP